MRIIIPIRREKGIKKVRKRNRKTIRRTERKTRRRRTGKRIDTIRSIRNTAPKIRVRRARGVIKVIGRMTGKTIRKMTGRVIEKMIRVISVRETTIRKTARTRRIIGIVRIRAVGTLLPPPVMREVPLAVMMRTPDAASSQVSELILAEW